MSQETQIILKVSDLTVQLQNQIILEKVSFNVKKGVTLGILGPNGAGKSVLLRTLLNLLPHTGSIQWMEKVRIGYVPQNISIADIPMSVKEFLTTEKGLEVKEVLKMVKLENGDLLNKRLGVLSGGQLRRVLIAWALIDEPEVLFLDEPTTGVDMDSEEPIYRMLNEIKKTRKITMFLITHDIHIIREYTDDLLAINKCVTFHGSSQEISKASTQKIIYGEPVCIENLSREE